MNEKDRLTENTMLALQNKLTEAQDTRRIEESKSEIWVIRNNKTNRYLSEKSNNNYYWVKDIEKARKFSSYEDVFDFIERESKFGNNGADNWEEIQLNESRLFPKTLVDIKDILSKEEYKNVLANYLLSYTNWISEENVDDNCNMIEDPLDYEEKIANKANIEDLLNCVWRITGKNYLFKESLCAAESKQLKTEGIAFNFTDETEFGSMSNTDALDTLNDLVTYFELFSLEDSFEAGVDKEELKLYREVSQDLDAIANKLTTYWENNG